MGDEERYEAVRSLLERDKFTIAKEDSPNAFNFSWKGREVDIWRSKQYLVDGVGADKYTVDSEGYVKFKHDRGTSSIEWDVRASKKLEKKLSGIKWDYTKKIGYISIIVVAIAIAGIVAPIMMRDMSHGLGNLALAVIFLWIPPLTVYTIIDHLQSNLKHLGVQNVAKRIEKRFRDNQDKLLEIQIKRYSER